MNRQFKHKGLIMTIVIVLALVILALTTMGDSTTSWIESAVGSVFQPVQTLASNVSNGIVNFFQRLFKTSPTDQENQQLLARIAQLEQQVADLSDAEMENRRLKDLLSFAEAYPELEMVSGTVIGAAQGSWFDTFTINLGKKHGVALNMPVVNGDGLVGYISEVGANWSRVTTIVDLSSSVSVMVERTRDNGMIRGTFDGKEQSSKLELYYLPSSSDLAPGDEIITNGLGGMYPKGIKVGTVAEVSRSSSDYNAILDAAVDFTHMEEVMVITNMPDSEMGK